MAKQQLSVIKIGGNVIENDLALDEFLAKFSGIKTPKILIHGGGKLATTLSQKLGIETKMIDGRRITDIETLDVITMVYGGLVNKKIVAKLQAQNINAIGLSGADANSIVSIKRPVKTIDYGFVGDVEFANAANINILITNNFTPVFCAITHDQKGNLLNTNADTIASQVAVAMSNLYDVTLYYCFELNGVLENFEDKNSVIAHINKTKYQELLDAKIIADGMLPKLNNCFDALEKGVEKVCIGKDQMLTDKSAIFTTISL